MTSNSFFFSLLSYTDLSLYIICVCIYTYRSFVVFSRLDDAFNFSFEMLPTVRRLNQPTSICYYRTHTYDDDDGMGRMRVTHFSEIISDSFSFFFFSFSLALSFHHIKPIQHTHTHALLMIDGAQQET